MNLRERPPEALRARVLAAAARQPGTAPGAWTRRLLGYGSLAAGWLVAMTVLLGVRNDWNQLPAGAMGQVLATLAAAALLASAAGVSRGRSMVGASSGWLLALLTGVPLLLLVVVTAMDPSGADTLILSERGVTIARAIGCDLLVLAVAAPLLGCAWAMARGLTLARPGLSGACAGLAAATWAHAVVRIHCGVGGTGHAILGHLLGALPLMVASAWLFARGQRR